MTCRSPALEPPHTIVGQRPVPLHDDGYHFEGRHLHDDDFSMGKLLVQYVPCSQFRVVCLNICQLFSPFFHEGGTIFPLVVLLGFGVYFRWVIPKAGVKISQSAPSS